MEEGLHEGQPQLWPQPWRDAAPRAAQCDFLREEGQFAIGGMDCASLHDRQFVWTSFMGQYEAWIKD